MTYERLPRCAAGAVALLALAACGGSAGNGASSGTTTSDPCASAVVTQTCIDQQLQQAAFREIKVTWGPNPLDAGGRLQLKLNESDPVTLTIGASLTQDVVAAVQARSKGQVSPDQVVKQLTGVVVVSLQVQPAGAFAISSDVDGAEVTASQPNEIDKKLTLGGGDPVMLRWRVTAVQAVKAMTLGVGVAYVLRDGEGRDLPPHPVWTDTADVQVRPTVGQAVVNDASGGLKVVQWVGQVESAVAGAALPLLGLVAFLVLLVVAARHRRVRPFLLAVVDKLPGLGGAVEAATGEPEPEPEQPRPAPPARPASFRPSAARHHRRGAGRASRR